MRSKFIALILCMYVGCSSAKQNGNKKTQVAQCGGLPLKQFAWSSCPDSSSCYTACNRNYQFPNGLSKVELICDAGIWFLKGLGNIAHFECEPICVPSCKNNGRCIAPDICICPKNFSGSSCNQPHCNTVPDVLHSNRSCTSTNCTITCHQGYKFADNSMSMELKCENGQFTPIHKNQTIPLACQPHCLSSCKNGEICTAPNKCTCPSSHEGDHCEFRKVPVVNCATEPVIKNGRLNCSLIDECKVNCFKGFELPDGTIAMVVTCQQGQWKAKYSKQNFDPFCTRKCSPPCQNGGECLKNNTCICPKDYEGNQCKFKKGCKTNPTTQNANAKCTFEDCKVTCASGYALPDNSTEMDLICDQGHWKSMNSKQNFFPFCKPVCDPPCQNGGKCNYPNYCSCPSGFKGHQCQNKWCKGFPSVKNARYGCHNYECIMFCVEGYKYPDKTIANWRGKKT